MAHTVIIGAGPTGLSAAYHLGADAVLLEQHERVGGWCRSIEVGGFTFDYAGHILFSNDPYVHELYRKLLGSNIHWQDREAWIYSNDVYTRYPFQGALHGLPPSVISDCLIGAIEARYGIEMGTHSSTNGDGQDGHVGAGAAAVSDCCADGVLEATAPSGPASMCGRSDPRADNFEEFIYRVWGAGIAKHFAIPYNRKLWTVPLAEMETSWLGGRVPLPDLREMIEGALQPVPKPMGPNARFGYVLHGGCQALMDAFVPHLEGPVHLNSRVARISLADRLLQTADGKTFSFQTLVSTMPLPRLVELLAHEAPASVRAAAAALRHISVRCVHLGIGREHVTDKHWIYFPGDTVFHRIFVQGNASPYCNPPGGFGLTCEISYSSYKPLPCDGDALIQRCLDDCRRVGLIDAADPVWATAQVDLPYAYVVYDHARAAHVAHIRQWMDQQNIILAGRYSEWEYYNSDHAFMAGKRAAEQVHARRTLKPRRRERGAASQTNQYA